MNDIATPAALREQAANTLFAEAMGRPHLTDARGAELLAHLKAVAPGAADELLNRWAA